MAGIKKEYRPLEFSCTSEDINISKLVTHDIPNFTVIQNEGTIDSLLDVFVQQEQDLYRER